MIEVFVRSAMEPNSVRNGFQDVGLVSTALLPCELERRDRELWFARIATGQ